MRRLVVASRDSCAVHKVRGPHSYLVGYRDRTLALLASSCALRPGEIVRLRVEDVVELGHHWLVMPGKRKHRPASPPIPVERSSSPLSCIALADTERGCPIVGRGMS